MSKVVFNRSKLLEIDNYSTSNFQGFFLETESYHKIIKFANRVFDLNLFNPQEEIPTREIAYMYIGKPHDITVNIGKHGKLMVDKLVYSRALNILVCRVYLKRNWTSNQIPHIILAKDLDLPNSVGDDTMNGSLAELGGYYEYYLKEMMELKGRIGVIVNPTPIGNSTLNLTPTIHKPPISTAGNLNTNTGIGNLDIINRFDSDSDISESNGIESDCGRLDRNSNPQPSQNRPKLATKSQSLEGDTLSPCQSNLNGGDSLSPSQSLTLPVSVNKSKVDSIAKIEQKIDTSAEYVDGQKVYRGPRGGRFIYKNGKRQYIKDSNSKSKSSLKSKPKEYIVKFDF